MEIRGRLVVGDRTAAWPSCSVFFSYFFFVLCPISVYFESFSPPLAPRLKSVVFCLSVCIHPNLWCVARKRLLVLPALC